MLSGEMSLGNRLNSSQLKSFAINGLFGFKDITIPLDIEEDLKNLGYEEDRFERLSIGVGEKNISKSDRQKIEQLVSTGEINSILSSSATRSLVRCP